MNKRFLFFKQKNRYFLSKEVSVTAMLEDGYKNRDKTFRNNLLPGVTV